MLLMARDIYQIGKAGAVGPQATAKNITFNEGPAALAAHIDCEVLAAELERLKMEMVSRAKDPSHYEAVAAIAKAEEATKEGAGSDIFNHLKGGGKWALETASKIGVSVAAKAIEGALGLK
jgi:hypothetical protein